jgi:hypothetical protein
MYVFLYTLSYNDGLLRIKDMINKNVKPETIRELCKLIDVINKKISSPEKKHP